uniref:Uncharacterized protein n=1 Tax=Solanum lycopersicum TaxID=4081 RepID=A0A3Q7IVK8_SOLLC
MKNRYESSNFKSLSSFIILYTFLYAYSHFLSVIFYLLLSPFQLYFFSKIFLFLLSKKFSED